MAIDPSIYGQIQAPQFESPINALAKVTQLRNSENQNKLFDMQVAKSERDLAGENALNSAYQGALGADGTIDRNKLYSSITQSGQGAKLPGIQKGFADQDKATVDAEKTKLSLAMEKQKAVAQIAGSVKDQATWDQGVQYLQSIGVDVSQVPRQYDPATAAMLRDRAMSGAEQLAQVWKQKDYDLNVDKFGYQKQNDAANRGVTLRGQNMTDSRGRDLAAATREAGGAGKPPTGYRFKEDGTLEAIPGGPADIKAGELGAKREKSQKAAIDQADRVINKVDQALSKVSLWSSGKGSVLSNIPGTDAKDLSADLETIKANLGFAELQSMREASPTGGALGAIAVQELVALQSTVASLDQAQSQGQLKSSLKEIKKHYTNWKNAVNQANVGASAQNNAPSNIDSLLDKYK